jgi:hypothetical protein
VLTFPDNTVPPSVPGVDASAQASHAPQAAPPAPMHYTPFRNETKKQKPKKQFMQRKATT